MPLSKKVTSSSRGLPRTVTRPAVDAGFLYHNYDRLIRQTLYIPRGGRTPGRRGSGNRPPLSPLSESRSDGSCLEKGPFADRGVALRRGSASTPPLVAGAAPAPSATPTPLHSSPAIVRSPP